MNSLYKLISSFRKNFRVLKRIFRAHRNKFEFPGKIWTSQKKKCYLISNRQYYNIFMEVQMYHSMEGYMSTRPKVDSTKGRLDQRIFFKKIIFKIKPKI